MRSRGLVVWSWLWIWLWPLEIAASPPAVTVEARAIQQRIHAGEAFAVEVRLTSTSSVAQTFRVTRCRSADPWQSSDPQLPVLVAACDKSAGTIELAPGATHTRTVRLRAAPGATLGRHRVRVGFGPVGASSTRWSAELGLSVVEVARDLAITAATHQRQTTFTLTNTGPQPVSIAEQLIVQRLFEGAWVDLSPLSASACVPNAAACTTVAPHDRLVPAMWAGTVCAQCECSRNGHAQPGTYRLVARTCDGEREYLGREITLAAHER